MKGKDEDNADIIPPLDGEGGRRSLTGGVKIVERRN